MTIRHTGVRTATVGDATEMARLSGELGYPISASEMQRRLEVLLPDRRHRIVVASGADGLLGWMHVEDRFSLTGGARAELMSLVVDKGGRRCGLGRTLVDTAEKWAAEQGLPLLTVRSNAARDLSHSFYESLGYTRHKSQHVYRKTLAKAVR